MLQSFRPSIANQVFRSAFTLIELLIVVAIIAILAAIAVPNLLEAQIRSKVSKAKADLRTLATGLESYAMDQNAYPDGVPAPVAAGPVYGMDCLSRLSTPVSYLTCGQLDDPFGNGTVDTVYYQYANWKATLVGNPSVIDLMAPGTSDSSKELLREHQYLVGSIGPDRLNHSVTPAGPPSVINALTIQTDLSFFYDPTNGTISTGDIVRTAKGQL